MGDIPKQIFLDGVGILRNLNEMRWTKKNEEVSLNFGKKSFHKTNFINLFLGNINFRKNNRKRNK